MSMAKIFVFTSDPAANGIRGIDDEALVNQSVS